MWRVRRLAIVAGLAAWSAAAVAQEPALPRFTGSTDLVVLHVSVTDRHGRYVAGLPESAFTVREDGVPQSIAFFSNEDVPVTVGLVVDSSMSMWTVRRRVLAGITAFTATSRPGDELFALAFNDAVTPALPEGQPFTSDGAVLARDLDDVLIPRGRTALLDAIERGLGHLERGTAPRKVLVLISDGGDNASHTTYERVHALAQTSDAVIYAIAIIDPEDHDANPGLLRRLAVESGGQMFAPSDAAEVTELLGRIANDIRGSYTVGYAPARPPDGSYRRIDVKVQAPGHSGLTVRTKRGYLATTAVAPVESGPNGATDDGAR